MLKPINQSSSKWILGALLCQFLALLTLGLIELRRSPYIYDVSIYADYSLKFVQGLIPYRDFNIEYPPLALVSFIFPRLLAFGRSLNFQQYALLFLLSNLLISTAIVWILLRTIVHLELTYQMRQIVRFYILLLAIIAPFAAWRYDLFPALLTLLALLCLLLNKPASAGIYLGLGISAKLYPVLFLPIFCFYYLVSKQFSFLRKFLFFTIGSVILTILPFALIGGQALSFLSYHQARGLHIESSFSGLLLIPHLMGLVEVRVVENFGAYHLVSPLADAALKLQSPLFIIGLGLVTVSSYLVFRKQYLLNGSVKPITLIEHLIIMLLMFISLGKVFSPQYMVWLLPFIPFIRSRMYSLVIVIFLITTIIFPFGYEMVTSITPTGVLLLNIRNLLVFVLLGWLLHRQFSVINRAPIPQPHTNLM